MKTSNTNGLSGSLETVPLGLEQRSEISGPSSLQQNHNCEAGKWWSNMARQKRVWLPYVGDLALIAFVFVMSFVIEVFGTFERIIPKNDPSLNYPFTTGETIPIMWAWALCYAVPMFVISAIIVKVKPRRNRLWIAILGLTMAVVFTKFTTDVIKNMAGRPRPDFYARCQPDPAAQTLECTGNARMIREGRKSFPSGHSSTAFAGLGFLGLFLMGQLAVFRGKHGVWSMTIALSPFIIAMVVAMTRVMDYRHHWQDVFAGSLLGLLFAYISYRFYFPSLTSARCHEPLEDRFQDLPPPQNFLDDGLPV